MSTATGRHCWSCLVSGSSCGFESQINSQTNLLSPNYSVWVTVSMCQIWCFNISWNNNLVKHLDYQSRVHEHKIHPRRHNSVESSVNGVVVGFILYIRVIFAKSASTPCFNVHHYLQVGMLCMLALMTFIQKERTYGPMAGISWTPSGIVANHLQASLKTVWLCMEAVSTTLTVTRPFITCVRSTWCDHGKTRIIHGDVVFRIKLQPFLAKKNSVNNVNII